MKKSLRLDTSKLVVYIAQEAINTLISYQQIKEDSHEVAGVFVGEIYPEEHTIIIKKAIVTHEENGSRYNVNLDIKKLQRIIDQEWLESGRTLLYLGEWHTHPEPSPSPSLTDYLTFSGNYFRSSFEQNLLLYAIMGTNQNFLSSIWIRTYNGVLFKKIHLTQVS
jgi:integrative and conjugative element protein (TIGR02256 family)